MTSEIRYLAQQLLHAGLAPLSERDARVIARVARRVHTARDVNKVFDQRLTMGQRLADQVAVVGGSWGFIVGFGVGSRSMWLCWSDRRSTPIRSCSSTCSCRCSRPCRRPSS